MAARKKGKKSAAWKDGGRNNLLPEFQPEFLGALDRLVRGKADVAPERLLVKVFSKIDAVSEVPCASGPVKVLASREQAGKNPRRAEAATRMQLLEKVGRLAGAPEGAYSQDSMLSAIEREHTKIEARSPAKAFDLKELKAHLPKELKGFAGVPALHAGRIEPTRWGLVKLGKAQGVFIEYGTCLETCEKNMLMAFNTCKAPRLEAVELNGNCYWMTRHEHHTLAAWRGEKDGWLYVMVTHCPFRNALALAELLRN
jgi:hypothetical protein